MKFEYVVIELEIIWMELKWVDGLHFWWYYPSARPPDGRTNDTSLVETWFLYGNVKFRIQKFIEI